MTDIPVFGTRVSGACYRWRPSAYAVIRNESGLLPIVRTPVACYLPGGGMEPGETPQQTVQREAIEECGFILEPVSVIGRAIEICYSSEETEFFEKDSTFLQARIAGFAKQLELDHAVLWVTAEEATSTLSHGSHRWAVDRFFSAFAL